MGFGAYMTLPPEQKKKQLPPFLGPEQLAADSEYLKPQYQQAPNIVSAQAKQQYLQQGQSKRSDKERVSGKKFDATQQIDKVKSLDEKIKNLNNLVDTDETLSEEDKAEIKVAIEEKRQSRLNQAQSALMSLKQDDTLAANRGQIDYKKATGGDVGAWESIVNAPILGEALQGISGASARFTGQAEQEIGGFLATPEAVIRSLNKGENIVLAGDKNKPGLGRYIGEKLFKGGQALQSNTDSQALERNAPLVAGAADMVGGAVPYLAAEALTGGTAALVAPGAKAVASKIANPGVKRIVQGAVGAGLENAGEEILTNPGKQYLETGRVDAARLARDVAMAGGVGAVLGGGINTVRVNSIANRANNITELGAVRRTKEIAEKEAQRQDAIKFAEQADRPAMGGFEEIPLLKQEIKKADNLEYLQTYKKAALESGDEAIAKQYLEKENSLIAKTQKQQVKTVGKIEAEEIKLDNAIRKEANSLYDSISKAKTADELEGLIEKATDPKFERLGDAHIGQIAELDNIKRAEVAKNEEFQKITSQISDIGKQSQRIKIENRKLNEPILSLKKKLQNPTLLGEQKLEIRKQIQTLEGQRAGFKQQLNDFAKQKDSLTIQKLDMEKGLNKKPAAYKKFRVDEELPKVENQIPQSVEPQSIESQIEADSPELSLPNEIEKTERRFLTEAPVVQQSKLAGQVEAGKTSPQDLEGMTSKQPLQTTEKMQGEGLNKNPSELSERGLISRVKSYDHVPDEVKNRLGGEYEPKKDAELFADASRQLAEDPQGAQARLLDKTQSLTDTDSIVAAKIIHDLEQAGKFDEAASIYEAVAEKGTETGRAMRAMQALGTSPGVIEGKANMILKQNFKAGDAQKVFNNVSKSADSIKKRMQELYKKELKNFDFFEGCP